MQKFNEFLEYDEKEMMWKSYTMFVNNAWPHGQEADMAECIEDTWTFFFLPKERQKKTYLRT